MPLMVARPLGGNLVPLDSIAACSGCRWAIYSGGAFKFNNPEILRPNNLPGLGIAILEMLILKHSLNPDAQSGKNNGHCDFRNVEFKAFFKS